MSINDIETKYKVSRRTAERMRDALLRYFPHMEEVSTGERIKRWRIPQRALNSLISFSAEELTAINTAKECLSENSLNEQAEILQRIETKIKNIIKPEHKRRIEVDAEELIRVEGLALRPRPIIKVPEEIISPLHVSILSNHPVKIKYFNKSSGKTNFNTLKPYGLLYGERNHYFLGNHTDGYYQDAIHHFILNNILSVEILPETFIADECFSLTDFVSQSFGIYKEEPFEVEWLFDKSVAKEAKNYTFHPSQEMAENQDDSLTVKLKTGGALEMSWHLNTWGDKVKIIKPTDFWDMVKKAADNI